MISRWIENSFELPSDLPLRILIPIACVIICGNLAILVHSELTNRRKKTSNKVRTVVRNLVDASALASIIASMNFIIAVANPNQIKTAISFDLLYNGSMWGIVQLTDMLMTSQMNAIFLEHFSCLRSRLALKKFWVLAYVWISLLLWLPGYTISPFFSNMNSDSPYLSVYSELYIISGWVVLVYNFYFMLRFTYTWYVVYKVKTGKERSETWKVEIVAIKGIVHCFSSSCANVFSSYNLNFGALMYLIWIPATLHFTFNIKVEKKQSRAISSGTKSAAFQPQFPLSRKKVGGNAMDNTVPVSKVYPHVISVRPVHM